jgi:biotin operon repressor
MKKSDEDSSNNELNVHSQIIKGGSEMSQKQKEKRIKFILENPKMGYAELGLELGLTAEGVRTFCKNNKLPNKRKTVQSRRSELNITDNVFKLISRKKLSIIQLADVLDTSPHKIAEAIEELKSKNIVVDIDESDGYQLGTPTPKTESSIIDVRKYRNIEYPIGFITDTHLGSKYERMDVLEAMYDIYADYGVETVYHGGNIIDGEARFNKYDIYVHGVEGQVRNVVEKYPQRKGIITKFITGDDHEGWYVQREHVNIGDRIVDVARQAGRMDLEHLGYMEQDIEYKQDQGSSIIRVIHAGGGSSYAVSYTSQKYVESLQGGEKPQIVLVGHFHKYDSSYLRGVYIIQGGCTQDQTPFLRKKRIEAHVGGVVLWVKQNELGIFTSVKVEWIPFYNKEFYKYHW